MDFIIDTLRMAGIIAVDAALVAGLGALLIAAVAPFMLLGIPFMAISQREQTLNPDATPWGGGYVVRTSPAFKLAMTVLFFLIAAIVWQLYAHVTPPVSEWIFSRNLPDVS